MGRQLDGVLDTRTYPIDSLVRLVTRGQVRIPSFQRGLRWTRRDVEQLFDSIVSGYPIGNFLLWKRSAEAISDLRIGAIQISAAADQQALFVVDGQQRLTSLANALSEAGLRDPRFALSFDLLAEKRPFVPYKESGPATQIPLPTLFDLTKLLQWYTKYPMLQDDPRLLDRANEAAKAIREFRVPVYVVEQDDASVLREIFDRMNNSGKQLTRAEVFTALHETETGERDQSDNNTFATIAEQLHAATGFGLLDEQTVFLAFLARRGPDITRDIRREFSDDRVPQSEFPGESQASAGRSTLDALVASVKFLQEEAGVPHFALLTNRYLLVVLARFFAHFPTLDEAASRNLRRWLWRAMLRGPEFFKGSASGAARTLASRITPGALNESLAALIDTVTGNGQAMPPRITLFKTNFAATRLLLNALWARSPSSLDETSGYRRYTQEDLLSALGESASAIELVPNLAGLGIVDNKTRSLPGNRVLLAEPGFSMPDNPLGSLREIAKSSLGGDADATAVLASHLIEGRAIAHLAAGEVTEFIQARQLDLERYLADLSATRAEWNFEDTPLIDSLEIEDEDEEEGRDDEFKRP